MSSEIASLPTSDVISLSRSSENYYQTAVTVSAISEVFRLFETV